jgi:c(7)-type cytochrome triheme protein
MKGVMMKRAGMAMFLLLAFASIGASRIGGGDITYEVKKAGKVVFSHDFHVKSASLGCTQCHPSPYVTRAQDEPVTMAGMQQGKSCGSCHNGTGAFSVKTNCVRCHVK